MFVYCKVERRLCARDMVVGGRVDSVGQTRGGCNDGDLRFRRMQDHITGIDSGQRPGSSREELSGYLAI